MYGFKVVSVHPSEEEAVNAPYPALGIVTLEIRTP